MRTMNTSRKRAAALILLFGVALAGKATAADPTKPQPEPGPAAPSGAPPPSSPAGPSIVPLPPPATTTVALGAAVATWWGHSAFVITTPAGATIAIDPWLDNPSAPKSMSPPAVLDAILVTHGHADHSGGAAQLAKRTGAVVIAPHELAVLIGAEHSETMAPGGAVRIKDATISLVEAVHGSSYNVDPKNVRYAGPPVGFVIAIDKGPTLYHAGDTDVFASMALIAERYKPTVALLPIGGHYTMDPAGAAVAVRLLKVKTVIPMHYGTFPLLAGTPADLRAQLKKQHVTVKVLEMKPGDTTKL